LGRKQQEKGKEKERVMLGEYGQIILFPSTKIA
jgi:hypothetical protein